MTGIFLGTFNPMHIGHISVISTVLNTCADINNITVIPAWQNPLKKEYNNYDARYNMCKSLVYDYFGDHLLSHVYVSDIEKKIKPKYTYDLFKELDKLYPDGFVWILTYETYKELLDGKWYNSSLMREYPMIILTYSDDEIPVVLALKHPETQHILYIKDKIPVSSTRIRNLIKEGKLPFPYINNEEYEIMKNYI